MVQAIILPLYFISGIFIPNVNLPGWLRNVAEFFPVQHLADGLHHAYDPAATGAGIVWTDIGVLALWVGIGLVVALRRFSWTPSDRVAQPPGRALPDHNEGGENEGHQALPAGFHSIGRQGTLEVADRGQGRSTRLDQEWQAFGNVWKQPDLDPRLWLLAVADVSLDDYEVVDPQTQ
jgi:hypothetical protein